MAAYELVTRAMPSSLGIDSAAWHQLRVAAKRLERYCTRVKDKIWSGNPDELFNALADVAEVAEISRRLYLVYFSWVEIYC